MTRPTARIFLTLVTGMILTLAGCGPRSFDPEAFSPLAEFPDDSFLFVSIFDDDHTCLDSRCDCPVSEAPIEPFTLVDGKLLLLAFFFPDEMPTDWTTYRAQQGAVLLYADRSQWSAQLRVFPSFPVDTPMAGITIHGVDASGAILISFDRWYSSVPAGTFFHAQAPQEIDENCKVLHQYRLQNHGLIRDQDVILDTP